MDARNGLDRLEQLGLLIVIIHVGVDEQTVGLPVNGLVELLIAVERPGLRNLDLRGKVQVEIFHHDSIRTCKERKNVFDEISFLIGHLIPVIHIRREIYLLCGPKGCDGLLVQFP